MKQDCENQRYHLQDDKSSIKLSYPGDLDIVGRNVYIVKENYTKLDGSWIGWKTHDRYLASAD